MPDLEEHTEISETSPATGPSSAAPTSSALGVNGLDGTSSNPAAVTEDDDDDDDDESWEEMEGDSDLPAPATCLFCPHHLPSSDLVTHCRSEHSLDLPALVTRHALDSFGYIRLVNFVRATGVTPGELGSLPASTWADQAYMKPALQDDPLLMIGETIGNGMLNGIGHSVRIRMVLRRLDRG